MGQIIPDPADLILRPWPGIDGKSTQHSVGKGMAAPVTALTGTEDTKAYVSWRDGKHFSLDDARRMRDSLSLMIHHLESRGQS